MLKSGKQIFLGILTSIFCVFLFSVSALASSVFTDVAEDDLFFPHIEKLYEKHFVSGDTTMGTGDTKYFRPDDTINRAEFAKITAYTRLAEDYGVTNEWDDMGKFEMAFEIFDLLSSYFNCNNGACLSIGNEPFIDVPETDPGCIDEIENMRACEPWFSKFIYFAVSNGFIKGYLNSDGSRSYKPIDSILRIHALKMIMVDNGNILPENDARYSALSSEAESLNSYTPKCLRGAENYIRDYNGGYTADSNNLLKYALLADRLDLFGNDCQIFGSYTTPSQRAKFLQLPLTRKETPRYFALTVNYNPIVPDRESDSTINTAEQNSNSPASDLTYKIPEYERTSVYDRQGGDDSIWAYNDELYPGQTDEINQNAELLNGQSVERPIYDPETAYLYSPTALLNRNSLDTDYGNLANYNFINPYTSEPYINTGSSFPSTANLNTCVNKTTRACNSTSLGDCITISANTSFRTISEAEFGTHIPTYYTSLWQKVSLPGKGTKYIPLDDVALDASVSGCGGFGGVSYIVGGGGGKTVTTDRVNSQGLATKYVENINVTQIGAPVFKYREVSKLEILKAYFDAATEAVDYPFSKAEEWIADGTLSTREALRKAEVSVSGYIENNKYISEDVRGAYFQGWGIVRGASGLVSGVYGMVRHPVDTTVVLGNAVINWPETVFGLYDGVKGYISNFCRGTDVECYKQQGELAFNVAETFAGTKLVSSVPEILQIRKVNKVRGAVGSVFNLKTVTHYGTREAIIEKKITGVLTPYKSSFFGRKNPDGWRWKSAQLIDHNKPGTFVQIGDASGIKKKLVGAVGDSHVTFQVPAVQLKKPSGILSMFRKNEMAIIEDAIPIPIDAKWAILKENPTDKLVKDFIKNKPEVVDRFVKSSELMKPELDFGVESIANDLKLDFEHAAVKSKFRAVEKAVTYYGGNMNRVSDGARSAIIINSLDDVPRVVEKIKEFFGEASIAGKVEDKLTVPFKSTGYRSQVVKVNIGNSRAEIQIVPREVYNIKDKTHDLYKELRKKKDRYDEHYEIPRLESEVRTLNQAAYDDFTIRNTNPSISIPELTIKKKKWYQFWK